MHHPQIYDLISIIEDYFLVTDSQFRCQVEPIIYHKPSNPSLPNEDIRECKGLRINRQLINGKIEINIIGLDKDSNAMNIKYFTNENPEKPLEITEFCCINDSGCKYNTDSARAAIKNIVIIDRNTSLNCK